MKMHWSSIVKSIAKCVNEFNGPLSSIFYPLFKLVPIFKDQTSLSERALKAREHHSMHALIVRSYTMSGSLSLTIGSFLVLKFGNEFTMIGQVFNWRVLWQEPVLPLWEPLIDLLVMVLHPLHVGFGLFDGLHERALSCSNIGPHVVVELFQLFVQ